MTRFMLAEPVHCGRRQPLRDGMRDRHRLEPKPLRPASREPGSLVQNLWWAAGCNVFAIPLAAGVLVQRGILLPPVLAAVLMSASTVVMAINAQLLRRAEL